jgi:hypothetical protein
MTYIHREACAIVIVEARDVVILAVELFQPTVALSFPKIIQN